MDLQSSLKSIILSDFDQDNYLAKIYTLGAASVPNIFWHSNIDLSIRNKSPPNQDYLHLPRRDMKVIRLLHTRSLYLPTLGLMRGVVKDLLTNPDPILIPSQRRIQLGTRGMW